MNWKDPAARLMTVKVVSGTANPHTNDSPRKNINEESAAYGFRRPSARRLYRQPARPQA